MLKLFFALIASLGLIAGVTVAGAVEPEREAANAAVAYIESLQNGDGGFPAFGTESSPGATLDAVFALIAAGRDPTAVTTDGHSPADYLATQADEYASDPGGAAKLALGVSAMGLDPADFGGLDLLTVMDESVDVETGAYGLDLFDEAFYILALTGAGSETDPTAAARHLRSLQQPDGGWEFGEGFGSDSNTTAMALQAIVAAGTVPDDGNVIAAVRYLLSVQNDDGGFGFLADAETDPNSTAVVIQALVAIGEDIDRGGIWERAGGTPMTALLAFQNPATGAFQFAGEDSPFATYQSVPGLMLAPFPHLETRIIEGPTPQAPTAVEATPMPTPAVRVLVPAGGGAGGGGHLWWAVAGLLSAAGAGAAGAATAWRRGR